MEVSKHICFSLEKAFELALYLKQNGLIKELDDTVVLDIYESDPHWPYISAIVKEKDLFCLSETFFSRKELEQAKWLEVRSRWHFDYPQPENDYATITYSCKDYCDQCGSGLIQVDDFRMKRTPKWGKRHFCQVNWVEDELFVDDIAKTKLQNDFAECVSFRGVKNKSGTSELLDFNQLVIPFVLEEGLIADCLAIDRIQMCPNCGIPKYHPCGIGMMKFKSSIFEHAPDIVKTSEVFGWGYAAPRSIIISQKVYRFLIQNQLHQGLVFSPIELVD